MFWVTRIYELLSATKRLNDSKTHIMSAASSLILILFLGVFGTVLSALIIAGFLLLTYLQLVTAGAGILVAAISTGAIGAAILIITVLWAAALLRQLRQNIEQIFQSQAPIVAPVINKVSNVAGSFFSGLRHKRAHAAK